MKIVSIYVPDEDIPFINALKDIAKREGLSVSQVIIKLVKDYVQKHGYGNPNYKLTDFMKGLVIEALPTLGHNPKEFPLQQVSSETLARIWVQAKEWLSAAEYELQKRRGGPITYKSITIP